MNEYFEVVETRFLHDHEHLAGSKCISPFAGAYYFGMTDIGGRSVAQLVRGIGVLALPYASQKAWLVGMWQLSGVPPIDELAMEFGDGALLANQMEEAEWIDIGTLVKIKQLDAYLEERSGQQNSEFWTYSALRDHPDWEHVRKLALDILIGIGNAVWIPG